MCDVCVWFSWLVVVVVCIILSRGGGQKWKKIEGRFKDWVGFAPCLKLPEPHPHVFENGIFSRNGYERRE